MLILDEVQCGISRSGDFLAFAKSKVKPDIVPIAKGIGGGFPIGAVLMTKKVAKAMVPGTHGSTFGGNPLAMAAGATLLNLLITQNPFTELEKKAKLMLNGMKEIMISSGIPFSTNQIGGMFGFFFSEELPNNIDDVSKTNDEMFSSFINL